MATMLEYKCPSCGGAVHFDSQLQTVTCPYCDTQFDMQALKELDEALKQQPQDDLSWQQQPGDWQEEDQVSSFVCQSCGGEILCEATTAATSCPYCGNPVIMTERLSGTLRPDLVIPFKLDKEAAKAALKAHFKGKPLLPKTFKTENRLDQLQGVYVPFWLFDADADADIRYKATRVSVWSDSHYNYTKTSYYSIHRAGSLGFDGVPVDGSKKMDDTLMESLEPYDLADAVDFQTAYLAGYLADRYDVSSQESMSRANQRIKTSTETAFAQTVIGYNTVVPEASAVQLKNSKARYALLPVWVLNTKYRGKDYLFAMNGQTGKFVGDLPINWGAFWGWLLGIAAIVSAAAFGISFLL